MAEKTPARRAVLAQEEIETLLHGTSPGGSRSVAALASDCDELELTIVLGHRLIGRDDALTLDRNAIIALDARADEPVELLVNGNELGSGEIVVIDGKLCVRVLEIIERDLAKAS